VGLDSKPKPLSHAIAPRRFRELITIPWPVHFLFFRNRRRLKRNDHPAELHDRAAGQKPERHF
jgi:hypothetical protein